MGYKLQQKPSCTAGYRSTMETGNRPENNERWYNNAPQSIEHQKPSKKENKVKMTMK
jgi:hypothetical protein